MDLKKTVILTVAVMLLVTLAFAGAVSAKDIATPKDYLTEFEKSSLNTDTTYYIKGAWPILSLHDGADDPLTINANVTLDFTGFTGSFMGIPFCTDSSMNYFGGLFGNVQIKEGKTLEIKGLNMNNVDVNLVHYSGNGCGKVGGIIGGISGTDAKQGTLKFTDCHLNNCLIAGGALVGGLLGEAQDESVNYAANVIVEDCSVVHCDIYCLVERVGGLIGSGQMAKGITVTRSVVANCTIYSTKNDPSGGGIVGGLIGCYGNMELELNDNTVKNSVIFGRNNIGGLIGKFGGTESSSINGCTVTNCVVVGIYDHIGGIAGHFETVELNNFKVTKTSVSGTSSSRYVACVFGQSGIEDKKFKGTNLVKMCAVNGELIRADGKETPSKKCTAREDENFINNQSTYTDDILMYDSDGNEIGPDEEDFWCKVAYVTGQKTGGDSVTVTSVGKYGTSAGYGIVVTDPEPVVYITTATSYVPLIATRAHNDVTVYGDDGAKSGSAVLHYDAPGKYTLTLNGFTVDTRDSKYQYLPIIDSRVPDLTIVVNGESTLSAAIPGRYRIYELYQDPPTVIYAEGDLTIKSADPQNNRLTVVNTGSPNTDTHAIDVKGTLTISSVTVDATAETTCEDPESWCDAMALRSEEDIIITHADVTATADLQYDSPWEKGDTESMYAWSDLKITASTVNARSHTNGGSAYGLDAENIMISESSEVTVDAVSEGTTQAILACDGSLTISSSRVKATAASSGFATSLASVNDDIVIDEGSGITAIADGGYAIVSANEPENSGNQGAGIRIRDCGEVVAVGTLGSFLLPDLSVLDVTVLKTGYVFSNATSAVGGPDSYTDFVNPKNWQKIEMEMLGDQYHTSRFSSVKISKIVPVIIDIDGVELSLTILYGASRLDVAAPTKAGCSFAGWFTPGGEMVAEPDGTLLKGVAGYTSDEGTWIRAEPTTLYAQWIMERGHTPSLPKDYTSSGYVEPMEQQTAEPTATPTPAAPTAMPTTKPTSSTSKSPAPVAGLLLGLGAAALLIRMRR